MVPFASSSSCSLGDPLVLVAFCGRHRLLGVVSSASIWGVAFWPQRSPWTVLFVSCGVGSQAAPRRGAKPRRVALPSEVPAYNLTCWDRCRSVGHILFSRLASIHRRGSEAPFRSLFLGSRRGGGLYRSKNPGPHFFPDECPGLPSLVTPRTDFCHPTIGRVSSRGGSPVGSAALRVCLAPEVSVSSVCLCGSTFLVSTPSEKVPRVSRVMAPCAAITSSGFGRIFSLGSVGSLRISWALFSAAISVRNPCQ